MNVVGYIVSNVVSNVYFKFNRGKNRGVPRMDKNKTAVPRESHAAMLVGKASHNISILMQKKT